MVVDAASLLFALVLAPMVGSLVATLADRMPEGRPIALARSRFDACGRVLGVRELVPIVSYLVQRGRCAGCGAAIPRRLPLIELAAAAIAILALWRADGIDAWLGAAFGWTLLALALLDWRHLWLPDSLTLPLIAAGLAVTLWRVPEQALDHLIAAVAAWVALFVLGWAYRRLRGREGLGGGDGKLLAAGGAWLGAAALPMVLLLAALGALSWALVTRRLDPTTPLPFGSFLAVAIWLGWLATI
jgi:leader peptidase (prepilin peptidase) / N-methyltransferase